jgi:peroxiredoxin
MAEYKQESRKAQSGGGGESSESLLPVGTEAPDFTLNATPAQSYSLRELRGKAVVLVFYPADWSPVCGDQLALYNELREHWESLNARLVGISVDGVWCHLAYSTSRHLHFPLLADFEPKGAVSRRFNAYREGEGTAQRALYVLDANGVIRWSYLSPLGVNPGADGILNALESMTPEQRGRRSVPRVKEGEQEKRGDRGEIRA